MITMDQPLNFDNIGGGAAREMFEDKLVEVLKNIQDPNTLQKKRRSILLRVDFMPSEDRKTAAMTIIPKAVLAEQKPFQTTAYLGVDIQGNPEAREVVVQETAVLKQDNVTSLAAAGGGR